MEDLLYYDQVDISYNGKIVVKDVSFSLKSGEILGIVGESGSGKSTLIKAAMGLLGKSGLVTKGDIWYKDKNLPDLKVEEMRKLCGPELGMIFQNSGASMCPVITVGDQIYESMTEHMTISREDFNKRACEMLAKIGLTNGERVLKSYPFELSGGMNQRVGICMAMLLKPKILLADEPTSALDVAIQKQVVEEMLATREAYNTSIVIVTHNIGVVRAMCDSCMVLKDGRVIEYGDAKQVVNNPEEEYTKKLMSAVPVLHLD